MTLLIVVVVFGGMVFLHEFGHFLAIDLHECNHAKDYNKRQSEISDPIHMVS